VVDTARPAPLLVITIGLLSALVSCSRPVPPEEVRIRAEQSNPSWQNYPEDIKAQLGAGPAAQWQGEPIRAIRRNATVHVVFHVTGPWATYDAAMPVLLRDPYGNIYRNTTFHREEGETVYVFDLKEEAATGPLAWVEVKYPHHVRRLIPE